MAEKLTVSNLVVVDFPAQDNKKRMEWTSNAGTPYAESCARQIWYGTTDDFRNFPTFDGHPCTTYEGAKAYEFLLHLNLGLLTPRAERVGETEVNGMFYEGWRAIVRDHPDRAKIYERFMQELIQDERLVRANIFEGLKIKRLELAARELSGFQHDESVLIVGDVNQDGKLSTPTDGLGRVLTIKESRRASEIAVTHPNHDIALSMHEQFLALRDQGKVRAERINYIKFKDFALGCEIFDRIYVTMARGVNQVADQKMAEAWLARGKRDNVLTHLKAPYGASPNLTPVWNALAKTGYISPEVLEHELEARGARNIQLIGRAKLIIAEIARLREDACKVENPRERIVPTYRYFVHSRPDLFTDEPESPSEEGSALRLA